MYEKVRMSYLTNKYSKRGLRKFEAFIYFIIILFEISHFINFKSFIPFIDDNTLIPRLLFSVLVISYLLYQQRIDYKCKVLTKLTNSGPSLSGLTHRDLDIVNIMTSDKCVLDVHSYALLFIIVVLSIIVSDIIFVVLLFTGGIGLLDFGVYALCAGAATIGLIMSGSSQVKFIVNSHEKAIDTIDEYNNILRKEKK